MKTTPIDPVRTPAGRQPGCAGTARLVPRGRMLFDEDDPADGAYEVMCGLLRLHRLLPNGRRQIIAFLPPGRLAGLGWTGVRECAADAVTDTVVSHHSRASIERHLAERPATARRWLEATARELRTAREHVLMLGAKDATERVASFVLLMAAEQPDAARLHLPITRRDIADYLGLAVETVSRSFTAMQNAGILDLSMRTQLVIRDRDALRRLASGTSI